MTKEKIFVFIDGFNLYHAICKSFSHGRYKWCNLRKLAEQFINPSTQIIKEVFCFTAYFKKDKEKVKRHKAYNRALNHFGVSCVLGSYRQITRVFSKKHHDILKYMPKWLKFLAPQTLKFRTYEEKETDVNMAVKIFEYACFDKYDHAFIVSGDSDLAGAIKTIKKHFPKIKFTNILPPKSKGKIMQKVCHYRKQITEQHLKNALLPEKIEIGNGEIIEKPEIYK